MKGQFRMIGFVVGILFLATNCRTTHHDGSKVSAETAKTCAVDYTEVLHSPQEFLGMATNNPDLGPPHLLFSFFSNVPEDLPISKKVYFQNMIRFERHFMFLQTISPRYQNITNYEDLIFDPADASQPSKKEINAGAIYYKENIRVGTVTGSFVGVEIYFRTDPASIGAGREPGSLINVDQVVSTMGKLRDALPMVEADKLVFVLPFKKDLFTYSRALKAKGITPVVRETFLDIKTSPTTYNDGKSYGTLRILSVDDTNLGNFGDEDIIVLPFVPLDVGPSSGIISAQPQVPHSHVVFRAVNQKIPDIYIPNALTTDVIKNNNGKLVELTVQKDGTYTIKGAAEIPDLQKLAQAYWDSRKPKIPDISPNLDAKDLLLVEDVKGPDQAKAYGAKGTNFALLSQALATAGVDRQYFKGSFLIPFAANRDFKTGKPSTEHCDKAGKKCQEEWGKACDNGLQFCRDQVSKGVTLQEYLDHMVTGDTQAKMVDDVNFRQEMLVFTRRLIRAMPIPEALYQGIIEKVKAFAPSQRLRFRSSTNAEDIAGLNGAGLYESHSGCLGDTEGSPGKKDPSVCKTAYEIQRLKDQISRLKGLDDPEGKLKLIIADLEGELTDKSPIDKTIGAVYASLWTEKAYLFRNYYGIDHSKVFMGILVQPSMMDEKANGVVVATIHDDGSMDIDAVSQKDDISITNPIFPFARPEQALATRKADGKLGPIRYASSSNLTENCLTVLTVPELQELADQVLVIGNALIKAYGKERFGNRLDLEFRLNPEGHIVIKQARPI